MASHPIYQFSAELVDYKPRMWRRFQVANNITLARLGYIIMTMYEMQASHLFCFDVPIGANLKRQMLTRISEEDIKRFFKQDEFNEIRHCIVIDEDDEDEDDDTIDAAQAPLKRIVRNVGDTMSFTYDFGDGWEIALTLEKIIEDKDLPGKELPRVLEGEGFGIIEDCGGPWGLQDIAKAFKKKKGKEYTEYCNWLGKTDLDLNTFDRDDINFRLKKVPRIFADAYEYHLEPTQQSINLLERKYMKRRSKPKE